ncbi:2OG-Fe(II) oxygenase [Salmonella enterica subsp. enterica serovar Montevideo]|nr:2OG-Fe(II) oxygenase [Salmonella enterica subsp. enterica serovar Montevideo]EEK7809317.1 2OG-Fe(II) oxygenase [Salmonella enterica subsp. enterica serovar Montevideo]EEL0139216.1 2OG-Fe(II) oxygenase [Salmonella enterica subsp. enterica serovar Montevideo]
MVIELERLEYGAIERLVRGEALAIWVRNFVDEGVAAKLSEQIMGQGFQKYLNAPSIGRIGMAFYEAENQPPLMANYFESVFDNIDELRKRCTPYVSPIDLLRCVLDEVWPAGAQLETLYGRKMYVGLSRVVKPGVTFLAHHDIFAKDAPDNFQAHSLQAQMAANIYLSMPSEGGALQIWDRQLSAEAFDEMRGDSYGIDPALLGEATLEVRPNAGDLVLFNSRRMHAVTAGSDNIRLSLSCFVGYRGPAMPLSFWS